MVILVVQIAPRSSRFASGSTLYHGHREPTGSDDPFFFPLRATCGNPVRDPRWERWIGHVRGVECGTRHPCRDFSGDSDAWTHIIHPHGSYRRHADAIEFRPTNVEVLARGTCLSADPAVYWNPPGSIALQTKSDGESVTVSLQALTGVTHFGPWCPSSPASHSTQQRQCFAPLLLRTPPKKTQKKVFRLLVLHLYGGIWVDTDSVLLKDARPVVECTFCFRPSIMGSTPPRFGLLLRSPEFAVLPTLLHQGGFLCPLGVNPCGFDGRGWCAFPHGVTCPDGSVLRFCSTVVLIVSTCLTLAKVYGWSLSNLKGYS